MSDNVAYLVPKTLWERIQTKLKQQQQHGGGGGQMVGAVGSVGLGGDVNMKDLMHTMAVNMSLQQSPHVEFVKYADQMLKRIMGDPNISAGDKVNFLHRYKDAYQSQRTNALKENDDGMVPAAAAAAAAARTPRGPRTPATPAGIPGPGPIRRQLPATPPPSYQSPYQRPSTSGIGASGSASAPFPASTPKGKGPKIQVSKTPFNKGQTVTVAQINQKIRTIGSTPNLSKNQKKRQHHMMTRLLAAAQANGGQYTFS